jgi:NADH:ubiquinone oxidoreductase subunit E
MPDLKLQNEARQLVSEFKPDSGHLLAALHKVHHHYGYIPPAAVDAVARQLKMTPAAVFGAISFYSELRTTHPPELLVNWCSGPACRGKGGEEIRRAMESVLGIGMESNLPDEKVGLHLAQCEGSCEYAPLVWLRRRGEHPHGPDGELVAERGVVRGHLRVADAIEMARRLKAGDLNV